MMVSFLMVLRTMGCSATREPLAETVPRCASRRRSGLSRAPEVGPSASQAGAGRDGGPGLDVDRCDVGRVPSDPCLAGPAVGPA
eukprot:scaffold5034_cov385-Prasinococcus_capsulatus_cf.AAC.14